MVLDFHNVVVIRGGSHFTRQGCVDKIIDTRVTDFVQLLEGDTLAHKVTVTTNFQPLTNPVVRLAAEFIALDFEVNFERSDKSWFVKGGWKGTMAIVDQTVYFRDNRDAPEGLELGNVYNVQLEGGFFECLKKRLSEQ